MAKLLTTKVFEAWLQEQAQNIVRYRQIEKSELLSEYTALKKIVESVDFQTKKQQLITTRYANTEEGKTMAAYRRQRKNMQVLLYRLLQKEAWKERTWDKLKIKSKMIKLSTTRVNSSDVNPDCRYNPGLR